MSKVLLKIGGNPAVDVDATIDFTTDAYTFCNSHDWAISLTTVGLVGDPVYTVQVSNDEITWYDYALEATNVAIIDSIAHDRMSFLHLRVKYLALTTTSGTVDVFLSFNNDTTN